MTYPSVSDARSLAKKHGLQRCIVFFTGADGRIGYASYGADKHLCESTRDVADSLWEPYIQATLGLREQRLAVGRSREGDPQASPPRIGNVDEAIAELRAAGLDAWDQVDDPEALLRELRGEVSPERAEKGGQSRPAKEASASVQP